MGQIIKSCSFIQWLSYYLQTLYAILLANKRFKFTHYDLHASNVLLRDIGEKFTIPYRDEHGDIIYLKTDRITSIIDYGTSYIYLNGQHYGYWEFEDFGVSPIRDFPIFDAYKLLLYSMRLSIIQNNRPCFDGMVKVFKFFNSLEDPIDVINNQFKFYYAMPYNNITSKIKLEHLLKYISRLSEFNDLVSRSVPSNIRILGCNGTDICVEPGKIIITKNYLIKTYFDFYDLVSRFEKEKKFIEIQKIKDNFDPEKGLDDLIQNQRKITFIISKLWQILKPPKINPVKGKLAISKEQYDIVQQFIKMLFTMVELYDHITRMKINRKTVLYVSKIYNNINLLEKYDRSIKRYNPVIDIPRFNQQVTEIIKDIQILNTLRLDKTSPSDFNQISQLYILIKNGI